MMTLLNREFGMDTYTLLHFKKITRKDLLYSTRNSAQCYVAAWMGGELEENGHLCMYGWVPSLFTWNYHNIVCLLAIPRSPTLQVDSLPTEPPGKPRNTGAGSLSLLQGIFLTQELNRGFLYCRQIFLSAELPAF